MVSDFVSVCSVLNMIVVGVTGPRNGLGWDIVFKECYAVARDIRTRVLFDPTAEFAGGLSGGGLVSYGYSRFRAQHVAGVLVMGGWLGRLPYTDGYETTDRVQTNLLVARTTGLSDGAAWLLNPDAACLAQWGAVVQDWRFDGGHTVAPDSVKSNTLSWLLSQRVPAQPSDRSNAMARAAAWTSGIASGQTERVLRECVTTLMSQPRSWYALEAQLVLDRLMTNNASFRSLCVTNLARGDFASDLFYSYGRGAALNADAARYASCLKALTGITGTCGDRAGDLYDLLKGFGYPSPVVRLAVRGTGTMDLWLTKDTPGLAYTNQSRESLVSGDWQPAVSTVAQTDTLWSASFSVLPSSRLQFQRVATTPVVATSPPWPGQ